MRTALSDFWTVFIHELIRFFRDWRSLAGAVGVPILIVAFAVLGSIGHQYEQVRKPRVVIQSATVPGSPRALLIDEITKSKQLELLNSPEPNTDLNKHKIDAVISFPKADEVVLVTMAATGSGEKLERKISNQICVARNSVLSKLYVKTGGSAVPVILWHVKDLSLSNNTSIQYLMVLVTLLFCRLGFSMNYSVGPIWVEEARSENLINIMLLPINRLALICAKLAAMATLAFMRLWIDILGLISAVLITVVFSYVNEPTITSTASSSAGTNSITQLPWSSFGMVFVPSVLIFTFFCATISFLCVATIKLKHVNLVLTALMMMITLPSFITLYPHITLDNATQCIPVLNVGLMLKQCLQGDLPIIRAIMVLAEMAALTGLVGFIGLRLMARENFILKDLP